jgi:glycosyltransferase involved in cell wall biosynthesis
LQHQAIVHQGFQQPAQLAKLMQNGDAFVLPSTFEPWGVVVQEFAAAGYPLIISDHVGARHAFLRDKENGYMFKSGNKAELKSAMKTMMLTPQNILVEMGQISSNLAKKITPDTWAKTLIQLM